MYKLVALYRQPSDKESFDSHYVSAHSPLMQQVPGLERMEVTRIIGNPMGKPSPYYLLAEMYFKDEAAYREAMASKENRAAGKDLMSFAGDIVELMTGVVEEDD